MESFQPKDWNLEDLEQTILSFQEIQGELHYQQAQKSLRNLVNNLDLNAQEQSGLEIEIDHLTKMLEKLENSIVQIAAFGMVGRGKSSVLNALLGQEMFKVGPLHGVTRSINTGDWNLEQITINGKNNCQIQLIDTPGIDEVAGEIRENQARQVAQQVDLILFIVAGDLTQVEYKALCQLREVGKPMILVFNKIDQYPVADRLAIYSKIRDERVKQLLSPDEIVMVAASPLIARRINQNNTTKLERIRGKPEIAELKLKISEILHREGKSLVALNTMLWADELNQKFIERKLAIRDETANQLIQRGVMSKAVAIALNPVTVLDLFTGGIIDVAMILSLSHVYGIPMNKQSAVNLLQKIAISMGGISASEMIAVFGLGSLKSLLGLSAPITGGLSLAPYFSVAIAQAGVAGVSSYGIGQITKTYLANGASWGVDGPKAVISRILDSLDEASIINRIKVELSTKLGTNQLNNH